MANKMHKADNSLNEKYRLSLIFLFATLLFIADFFYSRKYEQNEIVCDNNIFLLNIPVNCNIS